MSRIAQIQALVRSGLYYLTEHADDEAAADGFDRARFGERGRKYEVVGSALDGRRIGVVCRITQAGKVRVITVYEDKPKR